MYIFNWRLICLISYDEALLSAIRISCKLIFISFLSPKYPQPLISWLVRGGWWLVVPRERYFDHQVLQCKYFLCSSSVTVVIKTCYQLVIVIWCSIITIKIVFTLISQLYIKWVCFVTLAVKRECNKTRY